MPIVMPSGPESVGRPHVARAVLGRLLRDLRDQRQVSRDDAARHIGCTPPTISRIELGDTRVAENDAARLLDLYAVTDLGQRVALLQLAHRLDARQWWHDYKDVLAGWFCSYLVLESIAQHIRTYEVRIVPGLLQTRAYAEAMIRLHHTGEREIQRRVDVRMRRQRMLLEHRTPRLWAVIDESALATHIAGPAVMREQIDFLARLTTRPETPIQVLPTRFAVAAAATHSFSILRLQIAGLSDVVYLEQMDSALFLDTPHESDPYEIAWGRLVLPARPPHETMSYLKQARDALP